MECNYKVYMHKNKINGKIYIGQTCQEPERRWMNGEGYKTQSLFYNAIKKYGWDNFEHIVLFENLTLEEANTIEERLIEKYQTTDREFGYNRKYGGDNRRVNMDTRKLMKAHHADFAGENNPHYGKRHTEETKLKISRIKKEKYSTVENHPMYGKHLSEEAKRKISKARSKKVNMYDLNGNYIKSFDSAKKASVETNGNKDCISLCCNGKAKTSGGYIWRWADEGSLNLASEIKDLLLRYIISGGAFALLVFVLLIKNV